MSGSKGETFCKRESARKDANCRKHRKPRNHFHNYSNQTRTRLGDKTAYPTHLVGPAKFQEFYELLNSKLSRWNTKYILKQSFSFTSDMCWTHCCWTVVSLMSARTCWLQVPHRTLYSIIRDMCDCLVSRIHPTPRMPLAYMRISPIRLDLFSTAFTLLAFFKQSGESSPDNWAWALSPGFAIEICDGVDFFDHFFFVCYSMFRRSTLCIRQWKKILFGVSSACSRTSMRSIQRKKSCLKIGFIQHLQWVCAYVHFLLSFWGGGRDLV